jgi:hypothetical protein
MVGIIEYLYYKEQRIPTTDMKKSYTGRFRVEAHNK